MSLADDVILALPTLRADAESLMTDTGTTRRPGPAVTDPVTGVVTPALVVVYGGTPEAPGRCKLQGASTLASEAIAGAHKAIIENLQIHFPVGSGLQIDDVHTIDSSVFAPWNVGLQFRLVEQDKGTFRTADRWNVELVVK